MAMRFVLAVIVLLVASSWTQIAISEPERSGSPVVVWEVFIDPLCVHCKEGWPAVMQVAERYAGSSLNVVVHPFPAP